MRKFALTLCMVFMVSLAYGEVIVYYDKDTTDVQFIIENEKKIRLSADDKVKFKSKKLSGTIRTYGLTEAYTDYKFIGGHFIVNTQKISDRVNAQIAADAAEVQRGLDRASAKVKMLSDNPVSAPVQADMDSAKSKLMVLGLTEDEVDSIILKYNGLGLTEDEFESLIK